MHQFARQDRFEYVIEQDYTEEFVLHLAPCIPPGDWLSPVQIIVRDDKTNEMFLGVLYETRRSDVVELRGHSVEIKAYAGIRIWEQTIPSTVPLVASETVVLFQTSTQRNANGPIQWAEDFHTAYCHAADFLEMPIRAEGSVYVPKEIPQSWYTLNGEQVRYDPLSGGADPEMESYREGSPDDSYRVFDERLKFRVE